METKYWLDSTTVRGVFLALIPTVYQVCRLFGLHLPDGILEPIADGISALIQLIGLLVAFWGRHTASQPLRYEK